MTEEELKERERQLLERERRLAEVEKNVHRQELTFDTNNYVVMANNMLTHSASNLTLDELKLLRFIIMQTKKGDKELYEFELSAKDFAALLEVNIKTKDLYKRLDTMTTHLMQEVIKIGDDSKKKWVKFHWVDVCRYDNGKITIKISDELKPFLVDLRGKFTRYQLSEIISFKSAYAIRLYEIINGYMNENNLPHADVAIEISISVEELRKNTDTVNKFERPYDFKRKVVDIAVKEINQKSKYHVTATPYKNGKSYAGFDFIIESQAGYYHRTAAGQQGKKENQLDGQMNILDYQQGDNEFYISAAGRII